MMNAYSIVLRARQQGVTLYLKDGKLAFRAANGKLSDELRKELTEYKDEIVALLGADEAEGVDLRPYRARRLAGEAMPMSLAQQRLWLVDQIEPGGSQYNVSIAFELRGNLNRHCLQRALDTLVERHEVLRTVYRGDTVGATQVLDLSAVALQVHDLSELDPLRAESHARVLGREEADRPFDLSRDVLLRASLVVLPGHRYRLYVTMHHIASDGWSTMLFNKELFALYVAFAHGQPSPLAPVAFQYADYAAWQRERLSGEVLERQLAYWRSLLTDLPALHGLPLDRPRPARPSGRGANWHSAIAPAVEARLKSFAREQGVTLFMLMSAVFSTLLARHANNDDVVFGIPVANREHAQFGAMIGFFANTLVLRFDLAGDPRFLDVLQQTRTRLLGAFEHQQIPFEKLVEELQPERSASYGVLFQVMLTLQNYEERGQESIEFPGLSVAQINPDSVAPKHDLTLDLAEGDDGIQMRWEYATDLFDEATIARMASHFEVLLGAILENPARRVSELPLLQAAETAALVAWNDTAAPYPHDACFHHLFEAQVLRTPEAPALRFEGETLSYAQLNARANRLARQLRARGVGPDSLVGLCAERSLELVVAIYGVWKAGGAYVPLDASYPDARLRHMLDDCKPALVLCQPHMLAAPWLAGQALLSLADPVLDCGDDANLDIAGLGPDHLAYVIFTSGSTGQPKGVLCPHRGLVNRIDWMQARYGLQGDDVVLQKTPYSFDVSVWELTWPLMTGALMVLARPGGHKEPGYLLALVEAERVTTLHFVPSMLAGLLHAEGLERSWADCASVRRVFCSGEALPVELQNSFFATGTRSELHNLYGPTEAAIDVSHWACRKHETRASVPIGRPIHNTSLWVLDAHGALAPIGVAGELHIGGVGLARGYLNRPDLTAERFVTGIDGVTRLYKTGDLVRWLADGQLEYLGRLDHQVKVRGFRIELGEVEAALLAQERVREAVVVARDEPKRLVAYVVLDAGHGEQAAIEHLRAALKATLPDYMVPAILMPLPALPLNANGKIDRKALPAPDIGQQIAASYVAPRDAVEARLAEIWQAVLGLERVGVHDNFFAVGGDSILLIQMVSRAGQAGIHLSARQVLAHQSIAELAPQAAQARALQAPQQPSMGEQVLLPMQRRLLDRGDADPHHYNQSVLLHTPAGFSVEALDAIVHAWYGRHDALRLAFARQDGQWRAHYRPLDAAMVAASVAVHDLRGLTQAQRAALIAERGGAAQASLDLGGPLLRALWFDGGAEGGRLLLVLHHLVVDGVSWRILLADLASAHAQFARGQAPRLEQKTSSLQQWGRFLVEHGSSLRAERDYWLVQLRKPIAALPVDHPEQRDDRRAASARVEISLDRDVTRALLGECHRAYGTRVNDVLLAGLLLALQRWRGLDCVRVDLEGHGREAQAEHLDIGETVGWFTSMYPLVLEMPPVATGLDVLDEVLVAVKERIRAVPGNGIGYGVLTRVLDDAELLAAEAAQPAHIVFNYLGQFDASVSAEDAFAPAPEFVGDERSPRGRREHVLELNGMVSDGQLGFALDYNGLRHERASMESLGAHLREALQELVAHCVTAPRRLTPSDFPYAQVGIAELRALQQRYPAMEALYAATPMQQGMLYHSALDASAYVTQLEIALEGALDVPSFKAAWDHVVRRHAVLRTVFVGQPAQQCVLAEVSLPWREQTLDDEAQLAALLADDKARGFAADAAPLMRMMLLRTGTASWRLVWTYHHALLDGWSMPVLFGEVMQAYDALAQGRAPLLPAPVPYQDYIAWLARQDEAAAHTFWRDYLSGVAGPTLLGIELPASRAPGVPCEQTLTLTAAETDALQAAAQRSRTTVSTVLQAAWAYVLHRYSGETEVIFGETVSGRPPVLANVESMVGLFINSLPVSVRVDGTRDRDAWLQELHLASALRAEHGHLALAQIQQLSPLGAGAALFDSLIVFENYPLERALAEPAAERERQLDVSVLRSDEQTNYGLTLVVLPGETLTLQLAYRDSRFEREAAGRLLAQLRRVLAGMADPAPRQVGTLALLDAREQANLLAQLRGAQRPIGPLVHQAVEAQVLAQPHAPAVVHGGVTLSYEALNTRANRLAHALCALGVRVGGLVALCAEPGPEQVTALLAILKAGAAYVPLDPNYPAERLAYMLADSAPAVVLATRSARACLPRTATPVHLLDDASLAAQPPTNPEPAELDHSSLAYVIYTSGSTGQPKGVMVEHGGLANVIGDNAAQFGVAPGCGFLQSISISFDAATKGVWMALTRGAALYPVDGSQYQGDALVALLREPLMARPPVTHLMMTPSSLSLVDPAALPSVGTVIVGGEACPQALSDAWSASRAFFNAYGPTECSICATVHKAAPGVAVDLGRPIANTRLYVVDGALRAVPPGAAGELLIGGAGVTRGYLNQDELTAQRFIASPFDDGARLYRTGDLVRVNAAGGLDYLGRTDFQVKIRGYRIELGEIEAAIRALAPVADVVVLALSEPRRLVAFVSGATAPSPDTLRARLSEQLPAHMLPSAFVALERMPFTANGKVDRRALAALARDPRAAQGHVAPTTPTERILCEVWQSVLGLDTVGVTDDFFAIGGDSILSIQAVARANQAGVHVTTRQLVESQNIRALARVAGLQAAVAAPQDEVAGTQQLLPVQQAFLAGDPVERDHFNQSALLLAPHDLTLPMLSTIVGALIRRHDALRLRFIETDAGWQAVYRPYTADMSAQSVSGERLDGAADPRARIAEYGQRVQASLSLAEGPLLRAVLFEGAGTRRLLLVIHHMVVDGVSWRILFEDLGRAYTQLRQGDPVALAPKTSSLQEWGQRVHEYARGAAVQGQRDYWLAQLNSAVPALPSATAAVADDSLASTATLEVALEPGQTDALLGPCNVAYRTRINDLLLSAVVLAMRRWCGATAVRLDLEGHGREDLGDRLDLGQTVGWFTSVYPVVLGAALDADLEETILAVKEQLRAVPGKGIGYGLLLECARDAELRAAAAANGAPMVFNYLGQFDQDVGSASLFAAAPEDAGETVSPRRRRTHALGLSGMVSGGRLAFVLDYNRHRFDGASMAQLAAHLREALVQIAGHCQQPGVGRLSVSDFPLASLDPRQLRALQDRYPDLDKLYPATGMQQGMLFHSALERGAYVTQLTFELVGELDSVAFREAWRQAVARHDVLRTAFAAEPPHQLVLGAVTLPWSEHDWRANPADAAQARFATLRRDDKARGFDAACAPLTRVTLVRLEDRRYKLLWSTHHALLDGWSLPRLFGEIVDRYHALLAGESLALPAAPPYERYIGWLRQQDGAAARDYWRAALASVEAPTALSIDRLPNPGTQSGPREQTLSLGAQRNAQLQALARRSRTTLNTVVQASWAYLLHCYSGDEQVVFGETVSGRPAGLPDVEEMVGLFINSLPVRVRIDPRQDIAGWLVQMQQAALEREQFGFLPLPEIQAQSGVGAGTALFDTLVVFENYPAERVLQEQSRRPGGLELASVHNEEQTNYGLTLTVHPGASLELKLGYRGERFGDAAVARMLAHLDQVLAGMTGARRVGELTLLSDAERRHLLDGFSGALVEYPRGQPIHALFEQQAERTPQAPAVRFEGAMLTYAELNARANRVAHYLRAQGVRPGDMVGLFALRSLDMVVGIYGIMKAGAAYLPLDPDYPSSRLQHMLTDSAVRFVLLQQSLAEQLPPFEGQRVALDQPGLFDPLPSSNPVGVAKPDLAYVIYTSGSTGNPKGVLCTHEGLVNRIDWMQNAYGLAASDVVLQKTPYSFDVSVWEFTWPLVTGACLVLARPGGHRDPAYLAALVKEEGVTTLHFVPSMLALMLASCDWGACAGVRRVFCSGEALTRDLQDRFFASGTTAALHNLYGPTEAAIDVSYWECQRDSELSFVPIGHAIQNTRLLVLDARGEPVPVGVAGELHLGGVCLARGYLNRPDLTAEKFIDSPFHAGERLYRTGDLVRRLEDGSLEYLGRIDHQVKIRGFRIELGEIEHLILGHEAVAEVVVVARGEPAELVAYVVTQGGGCTPGELRAYLKRAAPEHMVPAAFVRLAALPLSPNGKVDRKALPAPGEDDYHRVRFVAPRSTLEAQLCAMWAALLGRDSVGIDDHFFDLGGSSLLAVALQRQIAEQVDPRVSVTDIFNYPTIRDLVDYLRPNDALAGEAATPRQEQGEPIAIVSMACRFPDAPDVEAYWNNIVTQKESLRRFTDEELRAAGVSETLLAQPNFVRSGVLLPDLDLFDAGYFGFTPREAEVMDPQQRLLFECADEVLEAAGYGRRARDNAIGVFVGVGESRYLFDHLLPRPDIVESHGDMALMMANAKDFVSTRLSHRLNLTGPSLNISTACSTSLVAVHQACSALREGSCGMALAGGASLTLSPGGVLAVDGGIASADGHCRAFDADASGTRGGSGAGMVLLKRLGDALADGDEVLAVIKGSAINNDGADKVGYTAPSVNGQANVIRRAMAMADVDPASIGYVEAHGTGTKLGDPIEVAALTKAYRSLGASPELGQYCALGSVKTNIGHLDAAAGVAGLFKAVQALRHAQLPPSLHYKAPNPHIDFAGSPFHVNTELTPWARGEQPRRAAVSSFGIGGTNAHVVLEEAPQVARTTQVDEAPGARLFLLSAKTPASLALYGQRLDAHLATHPEQALADIAYTLQEKRVAHEVRRAVVASSHAELRAQLGNLVGTRSAQAPTLAFLFPGQGSQYAGMTRGLYAAEPVFAQALDRCAELLTPHLALDIRAVLYEDEHADSLHETWLTQPLLFAVEYALAQLWLARGLRPAMMLGHSLGEYVAACLAGVFSLEDALGLVAARGRLMQGAQRGAMLSVPLSAAELQPLLDACGCDLAAENAPQVSVASGSFEAIAALEGALAAAGHEGLRLDTSHAYHSALMAPILDAFRARVAACTLNAPVLPFISNLTGEPITAELAQDPDYWVRHLRAPVRFHLGAVALLKAAPRVVLEVGPGSTLGSLVRKQPGAGSLTVLASLRHRKAPQDDAAFLLETVAGLWEGGVNIALPAAKGRHVALPTYAYDRQRYWIERLVGSAPADAARAADDEAGGLYLPVWTCAEALPQDASTAGQSGYLLFLDDAGVGAAVGALLAARGERIVRVAKGRAFARIDEHDYVLGTAESDVALLAAALRADAMALDKVVYCATLDPQGGSAEAGLRRLAALCNALAALRPGGLRLYVVTNNGFSVTTQEPVSLDNALLPGLCKVVPQELGMACHQVDFSIDLACAPARDRAAQQLASELAAAGVTEAAYRGRSRWTRSFVRHAAPQGPSRLKKKGVYLLIGGLGNIGLALAEHLAEHYQARLVFVGRSPLPARAGWNEWIARHGADDAISRKLARLARLESLGAELMLCAADATDLARMRAVFEQAEARFGKVDGIIHGAANLDDSAVAIANLSVQHVEAQLAPKLGPLHVLETLAEERDLDFCLLMSSLSAVLGGLGFAAYAAANAYLDSFAHARHNAGDERWIAINWDGWRFDRPGADDTAGEHRYWIDEAQGKATFEQALRAGAVPQLVHCAGALGARLAAWVDGVAGDDARRPARQALYARPPLDTAYMGPRYRVEEQLLDIWQELLGIEGIGVDDDFFALGGDSLLLMRMLTTINGRLGASIPLKVAYEGSTVAQLSVALASAGGLAGQGGADETEYDEEML